MREWQQELEKISAYEEAVQQIMGVISARILTGEKGEIGEIHVLTGSKCDPDQVVREIISVFLVRFNQRISPDAVHVAQIQDEESHEAAAQLRPRLMSISLQYSSFHAEAKVQLRIGQGIYDGVASGPSSRTNRLRLVVKATLNALEEYLRGTCHFVVDDVQILQLGQKKVALVSIALITSMGEENLVGATIVHEDEQEALVKAALAAVRSIEEFPF
ncbi:MAG: hypothetical protein PWQ91_344 [Eubacteriales bacterium]|nr:hypothetical protein [Eubacteriales bacterium]